MATVQLIASTSIRDLPSAYIPSDAPGTEIEELIEAGGRNCYQAWGRKNPATATNAGYIQNIIRQGHESVLEHGSATFNITCSRNALAEISRHRHLSFSVLSQRFVDSSNASFEVPDALVDVQDYLKSIDMVRSADKAVKAARDAYKDIEETLKAEGVPRKQRREAARSVLPGGTQTTMLVTGNMRAWRDFLKKRHSKAADKELQRIAEMVIEDLRIIAPSVFADITYQEN